MHTHLGSTDPKGITFKYNSYYFQTEITLKIFISKFKAILGTQRIAIETNFGLNYGINVNKKFLIP